MGFFGGILLVLVVLALVGVAAWIVQRVFLQGTQLRHLVHDVNAKNAALASRGAAAVKSARHEAAAASSNVANAVQLAATSNATRFASLGSVLAIYGDAFFNAATTRAAPNVDLTLLAHTTALAGLSVVGGFDVSGGPFSVDAASGVVRMCSADGSKCSEFNADGTTYLRSAATVFTGSTLDASGADVLVHSVGLVDPAVPGVAGGKSGLFTQGGAVNVASSGTASLTSKGAAVGGTYGYSTCSVDSVAGMTVTSGQMTAGDVPVPGSTKQVLAIAPSGNVTINTPGAISITAPTVDITGTVTVHGQLSSVTTAAPAAAAAAAPVTFHLPSATPAPAAAVTAAQLHPFPSPAPITSLTPATPATPAPSA